MLFLVKPIMCFSFVSLKSQSTHKQHLKITKMLWTGGDAKQISAILYHQSHHVQPPHRAYRPKGQHPCHLLLKDNIVASKAHIFISFLYICWRSLTYILFGHNVKSQCVICLYVYKHTSICVCNSIELVQSLKIQY